jgi:glycosyltransferase involved in cell wall biosynthesis
VHGLFFDCRYIRVDHHDGISRFSAGLFAALNKLTKVTAVISDQRQLDKLPSGIEFVKVTSPTSPLEPLVALQLNKLGAKVVFSPMQTIGSFGRKFKLILTVHDLIYYRHPAPPPSFAWPIKLLWRLYHLSYLPQRLLLNRADAVATVSKTTQSLIEKHDLTKRPVSVVYNAAGDDSHLLAANVRPTGKQTLVYMGSFMDYKNVEVLIKGMEHLPDHELLLLSRISDSRKADLQALVPTGAKVEFLNGVTDEQYHELLANSVALVSGSRDEGFGIPLVESMTRGIPVVVSNIPIFEEIGGDAAIYFDQEDPKAFAAAVHSIDGDSAWIAKSKLSQVQANKFSWTNSAKALLELLQQI